MRQPILNLVWLFLSAGLGCFGATGILMLEGPLPPASLPCLLTAGVTFLLAAGVQWIRFGVWQFQSDLFLHLTRESISRTERDLRNLERDIKAFAAAANGPDEPDEPRLSPSTKLTDEQIQAKVAEVKARVERQHATAFEPAQSTIDADKLFAEAKADADRMLGRTPRARA